MTTPRKKPEVTVKPTKDIQTYEAETAAKAAMRYDVRAYLPDGSSLMVSQQVGRGQAIKKASDGALTGICLEDQDGGLDFYPVSSLRKITVRRVR